jgi:hypothetical protein
MRKKIPIISFIVLALCVSCFLLVRAQGPTASVTVRSESNRDPVQITRLFLGDQELTSGVDFPIGPDWVRDLKFEVKNVGSQNIKTVWLVLYFKGDHSYRLDFILGKNYWDNRAYYSNPDDITLRPGETAMVSGSPIIYGGLQQAMTRNNLALPTRTFVYLQRVVFEDLNSGWFSGRPYHREGDKWVEDSTKAPGWKDLL